MFRLPIETGPDYFKQTQSIPAQFRKYLIPSSNYAFNADGNNKILDLNIRVPGFNIWVHYLWLQGSSSLSPFSTRDTFALHFWLSRRIPAALKNKDILSLEDCMLFFLKASEHNAWPANGNALSMHVNVDPEGINQLTEDIPGFERLNDYKGQVSTLVNPVPYPINAITFRTLKDILKCAYFGNAADIYLRRKCMNLYQQYFVRMEATTTPIQHKNLLRIIQLISRYPEQVTSHEDIAKKFNIDIPSLKAGFEQIYNISLYDYVQQKRLDKAFHLLLTTTMTLREIAAYLGYPNYMIMDSAFELYYGIHPLVLRNAQ
jgi:AraC-like DNA-binding protein